MCESFGARLRQRREEQQITLSSIAEQTKIKLSLLEGLERDDVSRWPSGIFRRAFMRTYAHAIGLQPDVVVREFVEKFPDPLEEIATAPLPAVSDAASITGGPPTRFRYFVGAAVGSLSRLRAGSTQKRSTAADAPVFAADAPPELPSATKTAGSYEALDRSETFDTFESPPSVETVTTFDVPVGLESASTDDSSVMVASPPPLETTDVASQSAAEVEVEAERAPIAAELDAAPIVAEPDLAAAAYLCTELARVEGRDDVAPLLQKLARVVDAVGLIVWVWDPRAAELTPALPHGYSADVLAQLPNVPRDARNATAAAFRTARMCIVSGSDVASDALAVPLITPAGCAGVLAIELPHGAAERESIRALATIFAAQMARAVCDVRPAAANRRLA